MLMAGGGTTLKTLSIFAALVVGAALSITGRYRPVMRFARPSEGKMVWRAFFPTQ
jgi:hypothetical protein